MKQSKNFFFITLIAVLIQSCSLEKAGDANDSESKFAVDASLKIRLFGDSHAWFLTYDNPSHTTPNSSWNELLETSNVDQLGFPGATTQWLHLHAMDSLIGVNPDLVYIIMGANDAWKGVPLEITVKHYDQICKGFNSHGIEPVLIKIPPIDSGFVNGASNTIPVINQYERINNFIDAYSDSTGIEVVDINSSVLDTQRLPFVRTEFMYDGLHFNLKGYQRWKLPLLRSMSKK